MRSGLKAHIAPLRPPCQATLSNQFETVSPFACFRIPPVGGPRLALWLRGINLREAADDSVTEVSAPSQLHLFYTLTERAAAPDQLRRYRELLCPDERARADGFVFAHDHDAFEIAHALVRCALSRFAEVRPEAWRFDFNPHGRPRVAAPAAPDLDFNLSHARGIAACVIGQGVLVGVDVENTERPAPLES